MELTAVELWTRIQAAAKATLPEQSYRTWLTNPTAQALSDDGLIVEVPSQFHVEWIEDRYGAALDGFAAQVLGRPLRVCFRAGTSAPYPTPAVEVTTSSPIPERAPVVTAPPPSALNPRYSFDRYVVGDNSHFAWAACKAVSEKPARMYNPLFLYGGVGLGKTHLMHAIGNEIRERNPGASIAYLTTEQFTNDLVTAIQKGHMAEFRQRYRKIDLLLVDDVQFLKRKEATQEEFFHTFNALYDAQKQIVLTSDRPPKNIPGLEERLISRFEWGLIADIEPPDYETRVAILRKKASDDDLVLAEDVIDFIARSCTSSVREIEGAVIKLLAYSSLTNQEVTVPLARTSLQGMLGGRGHAGDGPVLSPDRIREVVARRWRVRSEALASKRRTKDVTVPRQVAMYLIKDMLGHSLVQIGELFGGRDHSTVIHSIRKVEETMDGDADFRGEVEAVRAELRTPS